jgi:predicted amidohydrolase YtcJ
MSRNPLKIIVLFILGGLFSVANSSAHNLVILNADVRTMDKSKPKAEAVAITGNKISAVGTNAEISRLINAQTKTIDANGKLVIPGFNDSHVHFFSIGARFFSLNLKNVRKPADVLNRLKFHAEFLPSGQWIIGNFQTQEDYPLQAIPAKESVDAITPNHPVLIYLKGAQIAFANSSALKIAGIESSDGILRDAAVSRVRSKIPQINYGNHPAVAETATNYAASVGVTSVQDVHSDESYELLRELEQQGKLKNRVYECIGLREWQKLANRSIRRASGDAMIRQGCLKYFSDGDRELIPELSQTIISADKADLQVTMHAIGESANDVVLTIYEKVWQQNGVKDRRFRIEHAHNFRPEDLKRFVATKTIASMQPALFFDGSGDDARLFRQMLDAKALLAFGSDANMIDLNPLAGIHAAVFGENSGIGISVEEAVRAYTLDAAFAEFQENVKGSITVGKLADLVILSDNIFTINRNEIEKVKVLTTIMDGRIVYQVE